PKGTFTPLRLPPIPAAASNGVEVTEVNKAGEIVGSFSPAEGGVIRWDKSGNVSVLPLPANAKGCRAGGITDEGRIAASASIQVGITNGSLPQLKVQAFVWDAAGKASALDEPAGLEINVVDACSAKFVVGRAFRRTGDTVPLRWDAQGHVSVLTIPDSL